MSKLEVDGIGEPVIIGDAILIPIGDIVYSGKLEISVAESLLMMKSTYVNDMTQDELTRWGLEVIDKVASKFTPKGIFDNLKELDNLNWIVAQWSQALIQHQKDA